MPKMKTKKASAKRFKVTGTGKIVAHRANKRHLLTHKSANRKTRLSGAITLTKGDAVLVAATMPYLAKA
jgi:large subunit ribosomal protein L35